MARPKTDPIAILRSVPNCRWAYRYTGLAPELRRSFFNKCKEGVKDENFESIEEANRWRNLFGMLAKTSREQLLARVNGDSAMLYHAFSWRWFCDYQKNAQRERRARRKEESLIQE